MVLSYLLQFVAKTESACNTVSQSSMVKYLSSFVGEQESERLFNLVKL